MTPAPSGLPRIERLRRWLRLERWGGPVYLGGMWLPAGPLTAILALAAAVFTPVLVRDLWALGRRGWLAAFVAVVGGALALTTFLPDTWGVLRWGLVLLAFYGYTWALGLAVAEWARVAEEAIQWQREKARWEAEKAAEVTALSA